MFPLLFFPNLKSEPTTRLLILSLFTKIFFTKLVDEYSGIGLPVKQNWEEIKVPNLNKIADGMLKIIENKKNMSESARTRAVENFDLKHWLERHAIIFNQFLS